MNRHLLPLITIILILNCASALEPSSQNSLHGTWTLQDFSGISGTSQTLKSITGNSLIVSVLNTDVSVPFTSIKYLSNEQPDNHGILTLIGIFGGFLVAREIHEDTRYAEIWDYTIYIVVGGLLGAMIGELLPETGFYDMSLMDNTEKRLILEQLLE